MLYRRKGALIPFLGPTLIFIAVYLYYPFIMNIVNSMFNVKSLSDNISPDKWNWFANYIDLFTDKNSYMLTSIWNSILMMVLTVIFQVGIAIILAMMVDSIKKGQQFYRSVFFFPIIISATALGLLFTLFYTRGQVDRELLAATGERVLVGGGMFNQILNLFGASSIDWKTDYSFTTIVLPTIWQYVGFYFVMLLTGLSGISDDVYESASIDGATGIKKTIYITLPLLANVIKTCIILALTGALKVFDLPWVILPKGAPMGSTYMLGTFMYYNAFEASNSGKAAAISIIIVLVGVFFSQVFNALLKQEQF